MTEKLLQKRKVTFSDDVLAVVDVILSCYHKFPFQNYSVGVSEERAAGKKQLRCEKRNRSYGIWSGEEEILSLEKRGLQCVRQPPLRIHCASCIRAAKQPSL